MQRVETPVLIVGAGPVGLSASLLLARNGVPNLLVDRRRTPHRAPQAHVVNPRSMEVFRQLGIDTAHLRRLATPRADGGSVAWNLTLAGDELGRLPYERQGDDALAFTPEPIINLSQHLLEPVLLEAVEHTPGSTARWSHEWQALAEDGDGVISRIRDLERNEEYEVHSQWVLAADGAGSPVRKQLGIALVGPDRIQSFLMIHFEANLRSIVRERPAILYWLVDPDATGTLVAHDIDRTWVFMRTFDPFSESVDAYDPTRCEAVVRAAIGRGDVDLTIRGASVWHMTSQIAERYRAGRVFLLGDSAHRFPPAGGMGMNSGIQDAHNLAWKLRLAEMGVAGPALLDTYESERRPVAEQNAHQSLLNAMKILEMGATLGLDGDPVSVRAQLAALTSTPEGRARITSAIEAQRDHFDMLGLQLGFSYESSAIVPDGTPAPIVANPVSDFVPTARPGARLPHGWIDRGGAPCSSLDLIGSDGFTLVVGPEGAAWEAALAPEAPVRVQMAGRDFVDPSGAWFGACEIEPSGALLVRPDHHVAWRAPRHVVDSRAALASAVASALGAQPHAADD